MKSVKNISCTKFIQIDLNIYKENLRDLIAVNSLVILLKLDSNHRFFSPCDLEIWWMTSKNYRAPLLHYIKFCASSQTPWWIQTGVTVRKHSILVKIGEFLSCVTLKFDGWPWTTTGHLFYATLSFVHHFKAIGEFKLELQSRNAQFGSKSAIFLSRVNSKVDVWPWETIGHLFYVAKRFMCHFIVISEFKLKLQSGNTQFGSKSVIFLSRVTLKFDGWHWKTIGHLFYATSSFVHHFIAIGELKLELQSGNAQFGSKSTIF